MEKSSNHERPNFKAVVCAMAVLSLRYLLNRNSDSIEPKRPWQWQVDSLYFGNGVYPSSAEYRHRGKRVQVRDEILVENGIGMNVPIDPKRVAAFKKAHPKYKTVKHEVYDVLEDYGGGQAGGSVYLTGWRDLSTVKEFEQYHKDLQAAWQPVRS